MKVRLLLLGLTLCNLLWGSHKAIAQVSSRISCALPLRSLQITSSFGYRTHPVTGLWQFHNGVDLRAHSDTVFAIMDGVVMQTGYDRLLGIYIRIAHAKDLISIYGHLSAPWVFPGEIVEPNETIGQSGCSGRTTGEHLHFSVMYRGQYIDPLKFLSQVLTTP